MSEYINIGLDFGTHQTKVCIEDSSDPRNRTYTFLKFFEGTDEETYFLPSIVQVNKDNTLSYGRYDYRTAVSYNKSIDREKKPKLVLPPRPKEEKTPQKPSEIKILTFDEFRTKRINKIISNREFSSRKKVATKEIAKQKETLMKPSRTAAFQQEYSVYLKETKEKIRKLSDSWIRDTYHINENNKQRLAAWEKECEKVRSDYEKQMRKWDKPGHLKVYHIYRYFKIASFSKGYQWDMDINPIKISIWYLTYVLFQIYKVVDEYSTVQMGIPQSISDTEHSKWQIRNAEKIFYSAYRLYLSYPNEEAFLKATLSELNADTDIHYFEEPDYNTEPGLLVLPEAFASLITLTKDGKISYGLNLLMDIGGGSTDISLFNVIKKRGEFQPNISHILSIHKGLNHLFKLYIEDNENVSIEEARKIFENDPDSFDDYIYNFRMEIAKEIQSKIYLPLLEAATKSGLSSSQIKDALYSRPVIYTGGGGVYETLVDSIHVFTDAMSMSHDFIALKNITNKELTENELSILSVSYGLSVPQMREPEMTPLAKLFAHIKMASEDHVNYEHGISDVE